MCYFVTVGVPEDKAAYLEEAFSRGLAASPATNASITRHLPDHYRTYVITRGMCSCDLFGGSLPRPDDGSHARKLRRKYERRGWSETKIERALAQAASKPPAETFVGLRPDLCALLAAVAEKVGELAVVVHWYDGEIETEKFGVRKGQTVTPESFRSGQPAMSEDQARFVKQKVSGHAE